MKDRDLPVDHSCHSKPCKRRIVEIGEIGLNKQYD